MKHLSFTLILLAFLSASAQKNIEKIKYGDQPQQLFDLFLPENYDTATPVVVFVHGGAWTLGDRFYTDSHARKLRDRGFVVANIEYRYVSEKLHWADLESDIKAAVEQLKKQAADVGFRQDKYHFVGISAGAHLSLMHAYTNPVEVASVTSICGPTNFENSKWLEDAAKTDILKPVELLAGEKYDAAGDTDAFRRISPVSHIANVPTLLIHGDKDPLVPISQSQDLEERLKHKNIKTRLIIVKGAGHDAGMSDKDSEAANLDAIAAWISKSSGKKEK